MTVGGYISANVDLAYSGFGVASAMLQEFGVASRTLQGVRGGLDDNALLTW